MPLEARQTEEDALVNFDCGVFMRGLPHEWHPLADIPDLAIDANFDKRNR